VGGISYIAAAPVRSSHPLIASPAVCRRRRLQCCRTGQSVVPCPRTRTEDARKSLPIAPLRSVRAKGLTRLPHLAPDHLRRSPSVNARSRAIRLPPASALPSNRRAESPLRLPTRVGRFSRARARLRELRTSRAAARGSTRASPDASKRYAEPRNARRPPPTGGGLRVRKRVRLFVAPRGQPSYEAALLSQERCIKGGGSESSPGSDS
jgi:hypothetical protein